MTKGRLFDRQGVDNLDTANTGLGPPWIDRGAYEYGNGKDAVCGGPIFLEETSHFYFVCEEAMT